MRKTILILGILILSVNSYAQKLEKIKKQNVFFVLLDHKDKLTGYGCGKDPLGFFGCNYRFFDENKKEFEYSFTYSEYPDADKMRNDLDKCMLFWLDKSFLRKNKDVIITRDFMEKVGLDTMLSLLYDDRSNKTIFLINTADTKSGKILVREVSTNYMAEE